MPQVWLGLRKERVTGHMRGSSSVREGGSGEAGLPRSSKAPDSLTLGQPRNLALCFFSTPSRRHPVTPTSGLGSIHALKLWPWLILVDGEAGFTTCRSMLLRPFLKASTYDVPESLVGRSIASQPMFMSRQHGHGDHHCTSGMRTGLHGGKKKKKKKKKIDGAKVSMPKIARSVTKYKVQG